MKVNFYCETLDNIHGINQGLKNDKQRFTRYYFKNKNLKL